jgi:hypothetical protein
MTPKQFIEKAIEGGWKYKGLDSKYDDFSESVEVYDPLTGLNDYVSLLPIIVDPLAWQAVGKVEGWELADAKETKDFGDIKVNGFEWYVQMHRMIDALCEGKSIEQFLETL